MKKRGLLIVCLGFIYLTSNAFGQDAVKNGEPAQAMESLSAGDSQMALKAKSDAKYVQVHTYDPARDADKDIQYAIAEAKRTNKRLLLEVGGIWCVSCRHMDSFFEKQHDVLALREKYFVMLKINFSDENKNEDVLSRYPKIAAFPHIFVLDTDGTLLHSQDTGEFEEGKGYNSDKVTQFLKQWVKAPTESAGK